MTTRLPINVLLAPGGGPGILAQIAALNDSRKYKARIVCADNNPASGNLYLPEVDARYQIPLCSSEDYIPTILKLIEREKIDFYYCGLDEELPLLAEHHDVFEAAGCKLLIPSTESLKCALDKICCFNKLKGKFALPRTFVINKMLDSDQAYEELGGKIIIKAAASRGGKHIYIPEDRDEYDFILRKVCRYHKETGQRFIIQEFLTGNEYNVTTLHDLEGDLVYAICRRKFETRLVKSTTIAAVIEAREDVIRLALGSIHELGAMLGFNNVEIIVSDADDKPYLIEINGGRTAAQDMNVVASGINLMDLMIDILRGEKVTPIPHPPNGLASLKIRQDIIVNSDEIRAVLVVRADNNDG